MESSGQFLLFDALLAFLVVFVVLVEKNSGGDWLLVPVVVGGHVLGWFCLFSFVFLVLFFFLFFLLLPLL